MIVRYYDPSEWKSAGIWFNRKTNRPMYSVEVGCCVDPITGEDGNEIMILVYTDAFWRVKMGEVSPRITENGLSLFNEKGERLIFPYLHEDCDFLEVCPFCGELPEVSVDAEGYYSIRCSTPDCICSTIVDVSKGILEAADAWNERAC